MTRSEQAAMTPPIIGNSGCFEIEATEDLLHRYQEQCVRMAVAQCREEFEASRKIPDKYVARGTARRVGPVICGIGALASAFGALLFYGDNDLVGTAVWGGISLAFVLFAVFYANLHWVDQFAERLLRRGTARMERAIRQSFEVFLQNAPYKIRYELSDGEWIVRSETVGERNVPIEPGMKALRSENAYCLIKPGFFSGPIGGTFAETPEQRALIEEFLRSQGIPLREV